MTSFDPGGWTPPDDLLPNYRVSQFMRRHGFASFLELSARASADPDWFFPAAFEFLKLPWMAPWSRVLDESRGRPFARWFVGAKTNVAWLAQHAFSSPDQPAVISETDDGSVLTVSAGDLDLLVSQAASGLRSIGVQRGEVVAVHLPMVVEAVVALLAVGQIGAIAAPAFSGYGLEALAERIQLAEAKVLITADGMRRRGRDIPMMQTAVEAALRSPKTRTCVVVPRLGLDIGNEPGVISWNELLSHGTDGPPEPFESDQPWLLAFTSGSTGRPKGAVHTHGGMPYGVATEFGFAFDVKPGDRVCWPSDMGWLVGPTTMIGTLALGATLVLFEGAPDHPEPDRLWRLVERHGLTHLGISPTTTRILAAHGAHWATRHTLKSLRVLASTGEPSTLTVWRWLHEHVGRGRVPIINWAGGTEVGGGILSSSPAVSTPPTRFSGPTLGMAADVVNEAGESVIDTIGELIVRKSWPSMTQGFWREDDRYLATHWNRFPDVWVHGDQAIRYSDGSWELPGRSDDVIKIAGKRVGPTELESIATELETVTMAGAVGIPHPIKGEVPVIALRVSHPDIDENALTAAVADRIERALGKALRPYAVLVVSELPLTKSGKVHRRALRGWLTGADPGDLSSLDDAACEAEIRQAGIGMMPS